MSLRCDSGERDCLVVDEDAGKEGVNRQEFQECYSRSALWGSNFGIDNGGVDDMDLVMMGRLSSQNGLVEFCWINSSPYGMDRIHNLDWGHAAWELCIRSNGIGRQAMDCLHNKGARQRLQSFVRWRCRLILWEDNTTC